LRKEGDGADRWGQAVSGWARGTGARQRLAPEWAGGACWAEQSARLGQRLVGKGESWAAVPGRAGKGERGPAGRFQERGRKEEKDSFLFYFFYFPKPFLNSNFNSF